MCNIKYISLKLYDDNAITALQVVRLMYDVLSLLLATIILCSIFQGTFLVMQTFAKAMTEAGLPGSIVNLSSIVGKYGNMGKKVLFLI